MMDNNYVTLLEKSSGRVILYQIMRKSIVALFVMLSGVSVAQNAASLDSIKSLIQNYQYKQAIDLINYHLVEGTGNATLYQLKGVAHKSLLKYPEAIYAYENALSYDSSNYQTYVDLGF